MYHMVGADGVEYGPVTTEQLHDWIKQGRANRRTMVRADVDPDWKQLGDFPEFQGSLSPAPPPAPLLPTPAAQSDPLSPAGDINNLTDELLSRTGRVSISRSLSQGWSVFTADFWPIFGVTLLAWALAVAVNSVYIGFVLTGPILGGLDWYCLRKVRGEPASLNDAFAGFTVAFLPLFLISIITTIFTFVGLFLLVLPGLYLMLIWSFAFLFVLDKKAGFWDAMELSRKIVHRNFLPLLGLFLLVALINIAGLLPCGLGLLLTLPWTTVAWVCAYNDIVKDDQPAA